MNHKLETHGFGGGEEQDEEYDDGVCACELRPWMRREKRR